MPRLTEVVDNARAIPQYAYPLTFAPVNADDDQAVGTARPMRADASAAIKQAITGAAEDITSNMQLNDDTNPQTFFVFGIVNPRKVTLSGEMLVRYKVAYSAGVYVGAPAGRVRLLFNAPASLAATVVEGPVRTCADETVEGLFWMKLTDVVVDDNEEWAVAVQYEITTTGNAGDKFTATFELDPATSGNEFLVEFLVEGD